MAADPKSDLIWLVLIAGVVIFAWLTVGGLEGADEVSEEPREKEGEVAVAPRVLESDEPETVVTEPDPEATPAEEEKREKGLSPYHGDFLIRRGNANREHQPRREYIVIEYSRRAESSVNITGWGLESSEFRGRRQAEIPQGTLVLSPEIEDRIDLDIILLPGEQAIVVTGKMPQVGPVLIDRSFKENVCLGYLSRTDRYEFSPPVRAQCPRPVEEPEVATLPDDCYEFVRRLRPCHIPEFYRDDEYRDTVDGVVGLSETCREFLAERYNYAGCVESHLGREGFWQPRWRVFLGEKWPMWAENRDVITLRDENGDLVGQLSY